MLKLLEEAKYLEPDFEQVPKTNPPTFLLRNRDELLRILDRVGQVPSLKKATEKAHTEAIPLHFLSHGQRDITHTLSVVKIEAAQLAKAIAAILPPEDPLSLAIRIPKPESLDDFEKIVRDVRFIFELTATNFYRGTVDPPRLQSFDVGSEWLVLAGFPEFVVRFIFGILFASASYRQKSAEAQAAEVMVQKMEAEVREAQARARKAEAEADVAEVEATRGVLQNLQKLREDVENGRLDQVTMDFIEAFGHQRTDGDQAGNTNNHLRQAIKKWAQLEQRDALVLPAANAPPEIAALCPSPDLEPRQLEERRVHLLTAAKAEAEPAPEEEVEAEGDET